MNAWGPPRPASDAPGGWRIPLSDLDYGEEEAEAIRRVLARGWVSMGPEVLELERELAGSMGARHAVAVSSGTAAIHLAFLSLGVGPGDEVVQPAVNFVAAANVTVILGAVPVFVDIVDLDEPTIDPLAVEDRITPRTKAVLAMHHGGHPSRMEHLAALCRRRGVALVEDACHAVGAPFLRARAPRGDAVCFSFFGNKNLATGEGGMIVTGRDDVAERARLLRSHGMTSGAWDRRRGGGPAYDVVDHGLNLRLDDLRAALGRAQLAKLPRGNAARGRLAAAYRRGLAGLTGWTIPFARDSARSAHHLMVAVAPSGEARDRAARALMDAGIQTGLHYPCIPDLRAFARFDAGGLERSRAFARRAITLPLHPRLGEDAVQEICAVLVAASRSNGACG
jgi:dTDP-4-amino-4,6-dideoxygalactose transaminase